MLASLWRCGGLERDNPIDPAGGGEAAAAASISFSVPLTKILLSVVHRVEAILVSAEMDSVVKELAISPLGPATGTIGTIPPASGYVLTLVGYDLDGNELFRGTQEEITIAAGDTTTVSIELAFTGETSNGAVDSGGQPGDGDSADSGPSGDQQDGGGAEGDGEQAGGGEDGQEESADSETASDASQ